MRRKSYRAKAGCNRFYCNQLEGHPLSWDSHSLGHLKLGHIWRCVQHMKIGRKWGFAEMPCNSLLHYGEKWVLSKPLTALIAD